MSDLISRSELINEINGIYLHVSGVRSGKGILSKCMDSYKELVIKTIKEQPTAFDTEKVVQQLEEKTDFLKDCTKYGNKDAEQEYKSYSTMMMYEIADLVEDLIDIVKKGGVE